jgi:hypothetical protein
MIKEILNPAGSAVPFLQSEAVAKADVSADELAAKLGTVTLEGAAAAAANVREPKMAESEGAIAEVFGALPSSDLFNKTKVILMCRRLTISHLHQIFRKLGTEINGHLHHLH